MREFGERLRAAWHLLRYGKVIYGVHLRDLNLISQNHVLVAHVSVEHLPSE